MHTVKIHKIPRRKALFPLLLALLLTVTACGSDTTPADSGAGQSAQSGEKTVTMAVVTVWETLMPLHTTSTPTDVVNENIYDRLTIVNSDNTFEPRLAQRWEMNEAKDTITYYLNPNAAWHDGEPVTAHDVVYTFQLLSHADSTLLRKSIASYFEGTDDTGTELSAQSIAVTALDDHTVELKLKTPTEEGRINGAVLRDFFVLPRHLLEDIPAADILAADFWKSPVGSGPFKFDSEIDGERIELVKNEAYFLGEPDFDRLIIRVVASANLYAGLLSGEIDIVPDFFPVTDWEAAQAQQGLSTLSLPAYGYQLMTINQNNDLPLEVRQAINIAINREVLIEQLMKGEGVAAWGPFPPDYPYFNPDILPIVYDVELARQLIADSGYDTSRELEFLVPIGNEIREKSAPLIQQDLAAIGIQTRIVQQDFPTLLQNARDGNYDLLLMGANGTSDPDGAGAPRVGDLNNWSQTTDTIFGELVDLGRAGLSFEERKPYYDQVQVELLERVPYIWLYFQNKLCVYNDRLSNLPTDTVDWGISKKIWEWKVD